MVQCFLFSPLSSHLNFAKQEQEIIDVSLFRYQRLRYLQKIKLISLIFTLNGTNIWPFHGPVSSSRDKFFKIGVAKDRYLNKNNSSTGFTTYLGKRFVHEIKIDSYWEAKYSKTIFHSFPRYILDIR